MNYICVDIVDDLLDSMSSASSSQIPYRVDWVKSITLIRWEYKKNQNNILDFDMIVFRFVLTFIPIIFITMYTSTCQYLNTNENKWYVSNRIRYWKRFSLWRNFSRSSLRWSNQLNSFNSESVIHFVAHKSWTWICLSRTSKHSDQKKGFQYYLFRDIIRSELYIIVKIFFVNDTDRFLVKLSEPYARWDWTKKENVRIVGNKRDLHVKYERDPPHFLLSFSWLWNFLSVLHVPVLQYQVIKFQKGSLTHWSLSTKDRYNFYSRKISISVILFCYLS